MVRPLYVPKRQDIVYLEFDPQAGHEQAGHRLALVLSPADYNRKTKLALFCPITQQKKDYPFEVNIPDGLPIKGVVLADQVKNLEWKVRQATYVTKLPLAAKVIERILLLLS